MCFLLNLNISALSVSWSNIWGTPEEHVDSPRVWRWRRRTSAADTPRPPESAPPCGQEMEWHGTDEFDQSEQSSSSSQRWKFDVDEPVVSDASAQCQTDSVCPAAVRFGANCRASSLCILQWDGLLCPPGGRLWPLSSTFVTVLVLLVCSNDHVFHLFLYKNMFSKGWKLMEHISLKDFKSRLRHWGSPLHFNCSTWLQRVAASWPGLP